VFAEPFDNFHVIDLMSTNLSTLAKHVRIRKPEWSWNECRAAIKSGRVTVNGETITDDTRRLEGTEHIEIHERPQKKPVENNVQRQQLSVYYHDEHIVVVEKESGIESVPFTTKTQRLERGQHVTNSTLIDVTRKWLEQNDGRKLPPLKVVHRLDKGTSGIMVFARSVLAERELGKQFREHDIARRYVAFCHGVPKSQTIRSRLVENRGDGKRGSTHHKNLGKEAITHISRLESKKNQRGDIISRVTCTLETGRTHQIRIHMSENGHPLCGDRVYTGAYREQPAVEDHSNIPRIGLHAEELGFKHPVSKETLHWTSPLPMDLATWWENFGTSYQKK
jgi:23S rRNA pseudouridine1911/1915/1917 synthase